MTGFEERASAVFELIGNLADAHPVRERKSRQLSLIEYALREADSAGFKRGVEAANPVIKKLGQLIVYVSNKFFEGKNNPLMPLEPEMLTRIHAAAEEYVEQYGRALLPEGDARGGGPMGNRLSRERMKNKKTHLKRGAGGVACKIQVTWSWSTDIALVDCKGCLRTAAARLARGGG